jgi:hypothetical protein
MDSAPEGNFASKKQERKCGVTVAAGILPAVEPGF